MRIHLFVILITSYTLCFALPTIHVENRTNYIRTEVIKASIPFPPGAVQDEDLKNLTVPLKFSEMLPLKYHYDQKTGARHSVAIAQLRTFVIMQPNQTQDIPVIEGSPNKDFRFQYGEDLLNLIKKDLNLYMLFEAKIKNDPKTYVANFLGDLKILDNGEYTKTIRLRSHFYEKENPSNVHALSKTVYMTLNSLLNSGEMVITFGNDTFEMPVENGFQIEELSVYTRAPWFFRLRHPEAYDAGEPESIGNGITKIKLISNVNFADGQTASFRGAWGAITDHDNYDGQTYWANVKSRLYPLADSKSWIDSKAAGVTGKIVEPRFPSLEEGRKAVEHHCSENLYGGPKEYYGYINKTPSNTGAQDDFSSTVPVFAIQTIHTGSPCILKNALVGIDRESWRPSFFWQTRDGVEDRVSSVNYPELVFWSGRPQGMGHNDHNPVWNARVTKLTYKEGERDNWQGHDNQHQGSNALRAIYELLGDPYHKDILLYYQSLIAWDYFTGDMNRNKKYPIGHLVDPDADRSVGRTIKEAIAVVAIDDSTPEAKHLKNRIEWKLKNIIYGDAYMTSQSTPYINEGYHSNPLNEPYKTNPEKIPFFLVYDAVDPRMPWCEMINQPPGCEEYQGRWTVTPWQMGFVMEALSLAYKYGYALNAVTGTAELFFDALEKFFDYPAGTKVSLLVLDSPNIKDYGGYDTGWWSGWITAAQMIKEHPMYNFTNTTVRNAILDEISYEGTYPGYRIDEYWVPGDAWRSFE